MRNRKDRVFIVGGGPSLAGFDFSLLDNEDTIAVNESLFNLTNPKYFITVDYKWLQNKRRSNEYLEFINTKAIKYFVVNLCPRPGIIKKEDGYYYNIHKWVFPEFNHIIESYQAYPFSNEKFAHGKNSGLCAAQLAVIMGYREIYLLGMDYNITDNTHYHSKYELKDKNRYQKILDEYYKYFNYCLTGYSGDAQFFSCSPISQLNNIIQYKNINEVL